MEIERTSLGALEEGIYPGCGELAEVFREGVLEK